MDWTTVGTSSITTLGFGAFLWLVFRNAALNKIRVIAENEINGYKQSLDAHTELIKHDLQRQMLQAQIATEKRHEIYSKLYTLLLHADGDVSGFTGLRREPTYEEFNAEDFEKVLNDRNVVSGKRNEIMEIFRKDRQAGIDAWKKFERVLDFNEARKKITNAKNFLLLNDLYISEHVSASTLKLTTTLYHQLISLEMPIRTLTSADEEIKRLEEITRSLQEIKINMMKELQPLKAAAS